MGTANALHTHGDGVDGGTDARTARHTLGGLLTATGPSALDIRTGVLVGPGADTLLTGTADTGPMTVQVNPSVPVSSRGAANGPYLGPGLTAATKVPLAAAPASGVRIDVVYFKQQDKTPSVPTPDAVYAPLYAVQTGQVGQGKPSIAGIVGAVELGTVEVRAGATSTNGANIVISITGQLTVARGGILPIRPTEEAAAGGYRGQYRDHPTRGLERWTGAAWDVPTRRPIFQGYADAAVGPFAAGWWDLPFAAETYDSHAGHGADPYAYVIPESGPYGLEGIVAFAGNGANPYRAARITVNHAVYANAQGQAGNFGTGVCSAVTGRKVWFLEAGTAIRLQGFSSSAWSTHTDVGAGLTSTLTVERLIGS